MILFSIRNIFVTIFQKKNLVITKLRNKHYFKFLYLR